MPPPLFYYTPIAPILARPTNRPLDSFCVPLSDMPQLMVHATMPSGSCGRLLGLLARDVPVCLTSAWWRLRPYCVPASSERASTHQTSGGRQIASHGVDAAACRVWTLPDTARWLPPRLACQTHRLPYVASPVGFCWALAPQEVDLRSLEVDSRSLTTRLMWPTVVGGGGFAFSDLRSPRCRHATQKPEGCRNASPPSGPAPGGHARPDHGR